MEYTNQAMCYELLCHPCFGLVSPYTRGGHKDMDHYTFIDSLSVLNTYMIDFANATYNAKDFMDHYEELIAIGKSCEKAMFEKTKRVNTHKGLIFVLGLLVASVAKTIFLKEPLHQTYAYVQRFGRKKFDELISMDEVNSNGERLWVELGVGGVRREAALGFPLVKEAVEYLDIEDRNSHVKTLMFLMSKCEDTTIIHRHGHRVLYEVQETMKELLQKNPSNEELEIISQTYSDRRISPGGSADLLCGAFFMSFINKNFNLLIQE